MDNMGLVHLYCGDGKGKTTAAMGLCLRALGHGRRVTVVQFLKDGSSGELEPLRRLGAVVYAGKASTHFASAMSAREKQDTKALHDRFLRQAATEPCDLLVLDEACAAVQTGLVDEALLKKAVLTKPDGQEVVLTGRNPPDWMVEAADYITEMQCHRHPFSRGIRARKGVEY